MKENKMPAGDQRKIELTPAKVAQWLGERQLKIALLTETIDDLMAENKKLKDEIIERQKLIEVNKSRA